MVLNWLFVSASSFQRAYTFWSNSPSQFSCLISSFIHKNHCYNSFHIFFLYSINSFLSFINSSACVTLRLMILLVKMHRLSHYGSRLLNLFFHFLSFANNFIVLVFNCLKLTFLSEDIAYWGAVVNSLPFCRDFRWYLLYDFRHL